MAKSKPTTEQVVLDLNNPEFLSVFLTLETSELHQVALALHRIQSMVWSEVYKSSGLKWEAIKHILAPNGQTTYSVRLSKKVRALVYRDGGYMRFLSLHPDHDSAYR